MKYLKTGEVAKLLNVNTETIRRWAKSGKIRYSGRMLGGAYLFTLEDLEKIRQLIEEKR